MRLGIFTLIFALSIFVFGQNAAAQEKSENTVLTKAKLIHEGVYETSELASLYIDLLRNEMSKHPNSRGVFIVYCGKTCQYGEVEAHFRGINLSLQGKGWKRSEFAVINGGYREKFWIQYWAVPEGACLPVPESEIDIKDVKFKGTVKRNKNLVPHDCC